MSKTACVLSMVCCLLLLSSAAESAFTERGGVRPLGMGGAFVALADDASAIIFNPAGLGQMEKAEFIASYDKLYAGLGDDLGRGLISYVHPSPLYGAFAVNTTLLHTPLYKETTVTFGYGRSLGQLYLGVNAKGLFASFKENVYTQLDPLFNAGTSVNGMALDLGMLWKPGDSFSFGLAALNVNEPNMALGADAESKVPLILQTGVALKLGSTVPTIDLTYRNKDLTGDKDINLHFGLESWLADESVALRAGANFYDMSVGASYIFGAGKNTDAQLDYAFRYPLSFREDAINDIYGTHQFSLNIRFGGIADAQPEVVVQEAEEEAAVSEAVGLMAKVAELKKESKYEEAIKLCEEVLEADDTSASHLDAKLEMGEMLTQLERYDEAIDVLKVSVDMASGDPRTHYRLATAYRKYGDQTKNASWYNKAIIEFERTKMLDSKFEDVAVQLSALYKRR